MNLASARVGLAHARLSLFRLGMVIEDLYCGKDVFVYNTWAAI
jgi:hypothetical protein